MIDAIARLGALVLAESLPEGLERYTGLSVAEREQLGSLVQAPGADQTLVLEFDLDAPRFRGHHLEECKREDPLLYLYREGPTKGPLALPYGQVTERLTGEERAAGGIVKTVSNRLVGWAKAFKGEMSRYSGQLGDDEIAWLGKLADEIAARQADLSQVVDQVQTATPAKTRLFLSLAFVQGDEVLHLGSPRLPFARLFLLRTHARGFEGAERTAVCSLCGQSAAVSSKIGSDVFKFATFDQPAYVAGGLERREAWRSFAICANCHRLADQGLNFVKKHLTQRLGSDKSALSYWVVPSLLNPDSNTERARSLIEPLVELKGVGRQMSRAESRLLFSNEEDLLFYLQELGDHVVLSLNFVETDQSRERILLSIDDVLPSRLRRLFSAKWEVEGRAHAEGSLRAEWEFTLYRHLFPLCQVDHGGKSVDLRKSDFLAILDHAFRGVAMEPGYLANVFIGPVRTRFVAWRSEGGDDEENEWRFKDSALAAWLTWHFLDNLGTISNREEAETVAVGPWAGAYPSGRHYEWLEEFFARSPGTFQQDSAKVALLLGTLSEMVRQVQMKHLGSAPFAKQLKSLRMERRDLLDLLPRVTQKLAEYGEYRGSNRRLLEAASYYLTRAGTGAWPITSPEINLYFSMGMNLSFIISRGPGKADGVEEAGEEKLQDAGEETQD